MWLKRAIVMGLVITSGALVYAPSASADVTIQAPCPAGFFCAYNFADYTGELMRSPAVSGQVDVANDVTTAADNQTLACWRGRNHRSFLPDQTTHTWPLLTTALASMDNKTDHFDHSC